MIKQRKSCKCVILSGKILNWCPFRDKVLVKTEEVLNSAEAYLLMETLKWGNLNLAVSSIIKHSNLKITGELMLTDMESVPSTSKKQSMKKGHHQEQVIICDETTFSGKKCWILPASWGHCLSWQHNKVWVMDILFFDWLQFCFIPEVKKICFLSRNFLLSTVLPAILNESLMYEDKHLEVLYLL